jgi:hypothetical protein
VHISRFAFRVAAVLLLIMPIAAGSTTGPAGASVAAGAGPGLSITAQLTGVAAVSASNAWVAGYTGGPASPDILIEHWDGSTWKQVLVSGVVKGVLNAIAATSANSVWAVGSTGSFDSGNTLVLHWDGTTWAKVPSPSPPAKYGDDLLGVTAPSASSAWAVGVSDSTASYPLVLHWDGKTWAQASSPSLKGSYLGGVTVPSTSSGWAVGEDEATMAVPVLEQWNGKAWSLAHSPISGVYDYLASVASASASNGWAVGYNASATPAALSMHWNGTTWQQVSIPSPASKALDAVTAVPGGTAWAVGNTIVGQGGSTPLILLWAGTDWKSVPTPAADGTLYAVTATSASDAWAAGYTTSDKTLIYHWNGKSWT